MLETLLKLNSKDAWQFFSKNCKNPETAQRQTLLSILKAAAGCRFAEKYGFSHISTVDAFRKKVPISIWADYEKISAKMQAGEPDLLFKGKPTAFILTSGSSGKPKLIPETGNGIRAKSATEKLRRHFIFDYAPEIKQKKIFPLTNSGEMGTTPSGIPFGTASGLTMMNTPKELLATIAFPLSVFKTNNPDTLDYLMMRFALAENVGIIIGNNIARMEKLVKVAEKYASEICDDIETGEISSRIKINDDVCRVLTENIKPNPARANELRRILKEKEDFIPSAYWPGLKIISGWLSGSVGTSVEHIKWMFGPNVTYFDYGYGASEGKFNIPYKPEISSGPLAIHGAFYEFIPFRDTETQHTEEQPLLAHQLEAGQLYEMIITTWSGLYRYKLHDIIRVDGFFENTPEIVFVSKTGDIGNIAGEKLAGTTIKNAITRISTEFGIQIQHSCAVTMDSPLHYLFCIELEAKPGNTLSGNNKTQFLKQLDGELKKDIAYGNKRRDNLLKTPEICIMKPGWSESLYREKIGPGRTSAQVKLPVIYHKQIPAADYIDEK